MIADDYIRTTLREIRQAYHASVAAWAVGDTLEMAKQLLESERKTHELLDKMHNHTPFDT